MGGRPDPGEEFNFLLTKEFLPKRFCKHEKRKGKNSNLGRKAFLLPYTSLSQSIPEGAVGAQGSNLKVVTEAKVMDQLCLLASSQQFAQPAF